MTQAAAKTEQPEQPRPGDTDRTRLAYAKSLLHRVLYEGNDRERNLALIREIRRFIEGS